MSLSLPLLDPCTAALTPFVECGALGASDVYVAATIARAVGGVSDEALLGAALAARAPRFGHVCVVPATVGGTVVLDDARLAGGEALPWPDPSCWADLLSHCPAVRHPDAPQGDTVLPLVWDGTRLYLDRYWRFEESVAGDLRRRAGESGGIATPSAELDTILAELVGPTDSSAPDLQRAAAYRALTHRLAVIAGGPGTGKTYTVARLLAAAHRVALARGEVLEFALAAPTGKAAARMTEAVRAAASATDQLGGVAEALRSADATTLHRLLGARGGTHFRHDRLDPLPHDLVVVDETSMVSLPLMARLLDAVRPDATLVLVGDPFQLASVEAGAAFGEIVGTEASRAAGGPLAEAVVLLERAHRFSIDSAISALAEAVRSGDADRAIELLRHDRSGELTWIDADDGRVDSLRNEVAADAVAVVRAAQAGDATAGLRHASDRKVLCATRWGPLGVHRWSDRIEALTARAIPGAGIGRPWYVGRPIIVTRNDYPNRLFNGDVGLVVAGSGRPVVAFPDPTGTRELAMSQLGEVETWWATTIHKSQGSEFRRVIVTLPPPPSPILTRELLYTAVTRAREQVTLVAPESSLRAAIDRPVARASGLGPKLWP